MQGKANYICVLCETRSQKGPINTQNWPTGRRRRAHVSDKAVRSTHGVSTSDPRPGVPMVLKPLSYILNAFIPHYRTNCDVISPLQRERGRCISGDRLTA